MRVRIIVPHCKIDAATIDSFYCSDCQWSYAISEPICCAISIEDGALACRDFDAHRCEDCNSGTTMKAA
jgi:hypothetical protein